MNTNDLPNDIKQEINLYNETRLHWLFVKILQMETCAAALLGTFFVNQDHRDEMLGLSVASGLMAYGIHRREENKKQSIENNIKYFNHFDQMTWQEKEDCYHATKFMQKKEKEGLKIMGASLVCCVIGQPILGAFVAAGGLLHSTTSRDFIKEKERIVNRYTYPLREKQKER